MARNKSSETRSQNKLRKGAAIVEEYDKLKRKGYRVEKILEVLGERFFLSPNTVSNYRFYYLASLKQG